MLKLKTMGLKLKTVRANFKNWLRICSLKKKLFLASGLIIIIAALYFLLVLLTIDRAELKLAELKNSWENEKICHEDCSLNRQLAVKVITKAIKDDSGCRVSQRLRIYFQDDNSDEKFKVELVKILQLAYGKDNPPDYVREYLADLAKNPEVQASIISYFSPESLAVSKTETTSPLDFYFRILAGRRSLFLKEAAVNSVSNYSDKSGSFTASQLIIIKKIVFNPETDNHLRASLVLLLSDYYPLFPIETTLILKTISETDSSGDAVSRAFAIDILNRLTDAKLALPEVSPAQWDEYYNN